MEIYKYISTDGGLDLADKEPEKAVEVAEEDKPF